MKVSVLPEQFKNSFFIRWLKIVVRVVQEINNDRIGLTAAGIAFYALLAIFPGLAAMISLWGFFADTAEIANQIHALRGLLPQDVAAILSNQAREVSATDRGAIGLAFIASLGLAFFSASRGVKAIMDALNIVYKQRESRGFFRFNFVAFLMTIAIVVGVVAAIGLIVVIPIVLEFVGVGRIFEPLIGYARWPVLFVGAWLGIAALYRFAPSRDNAEWKWISPGAGAAVVLWIFASILFSVYVQNFADYNETYGSIGAVVVLLMWFWVSAFVFLVGAEVDAEIERR